MIQPTKATVQKVCLQAREEGAKIAARVTVGNVTREWDVTGQAAILVASMVQQKGGECILTLKRAAGGEPIKFRLTSQHVTDEQQSQAE